MSGGDLPGGWVSIALDKVCWVIRGITFPSNAKEFVETPDNVCCLRTANIQEIVDFTDVYYVNRNFVKNKNQLVEVGDVLMSMANSYALVGKVAMVDKIVHPTAFGAFLAAVRPTQFIENKYLFYVLRADAVQKELRAGASQTTNIANISVGKLANIEIPLAPLAEQKRIADKLDTLLGQVDACRQRLERVPEIIKRFRQAVLAAATSGKLTEDWRSNLFAENMISNFSEARLKDVALDIRYGTSKKCLPAKTGIGVLRIPNIVNFGKLDTSELKYASFSYDELEKLSLKAGDILVVRSNGSLELVGKASVVSDKEAGLLFAGYLIRVRLNLNIVEAKYVQYCLSTIEQRQHIQQISKSTSGVNNINADELRNLPLNIPSLPEQSEIVRRVETLFALADRLEARHAAALQRVEQLTPSLLAQAFRGELVAQDPQDEAAGVLLAKIAQERGQVVAAAKPRKARNKEQT